MNRRVFILGAVAVVAVVALWWVLIYAPKGKQLSDQQTNLTTAQRQTQQLQAQVNQLKDLQSRSTQLQAQLAHLSAAVPPTADQADFITSLNDIANASGITWQSVTFQPPASSGSSSATAAAGTGAPAIPLQIQIKGGFFQVTDYLNRLETLDRLVVVDGVQITNGGSKGASTGLTRSASGALTVTLNSRIFSQASVSPTTGTGAGVPNGGGSTGGNGTVG